ncbi:MAG: branched-chain-amino-acid transaminase [Verrucomicrobia bacterium]|jgi:branched-chain amino acid aminotransferase|nr:branched-chain-amino-acid transaminase [Verrucomicrobiota bacterium]
MKIYIDGEFLDKEHAKISVFDHGLLYGDGIFEGIRFYNGRVFRLDEHIDRLFHSARAIALDIGMDKAAVAEATLETIRQNKLRDGYIRLVVTRGIGDLGLNPYLCPKATVFIIASAITLYPAEKYEKGLEIVTCATRRIAHGALSPMVKSLNYLNNVLAKIEALQAGAGEGLMLNEQGLVSECTGDNIFIVKNGAIHTPPIASGALAGVTRAIVFEMAAEFGIPIHEPMMTRYDIYTADECFLTGTAAEVIPAVKLDTRPIGDGRPGPVTARLMGRFHELTATTGTPIYP